MVRYADDFVVLCRNEAEGRADRGGFGAAQSSSQQLAQLLHADARASQDGEQRTGRQRLSAMHSDDGTTSGVVLVTQKHVTAGLPQLNEASTLEFPDEPLAADLRRSAHTIWTGTVSMLERGSGIG